MSPAVVGTRADRSLVGLFAQIPSRLPPPLLSIPFGLSGLGALWRLMERQYDSPPAVADGIYLVAGALWLWIAVAYLLALLVAPRGVLALLRDPTVSPFLALVFVTGMMLSRGLAPHAYAVAEPAFFAFFAATILLGGWLAGQWVSSNLDAEHLHSAYLLPLVGGTLLGAQGAAAFGNSSLGWMSFGIGLIYWLLIGSVLLDRQMLSGPIAPALVPTLAIEAAPPAVAGGAYFALHGGAPTPVAYGLAGYAVVAVLVQLRLMPLYLRLPFAPAFWAFTFTSSAVAALGLRWLHVEAPPHQTVYAALLAGAVSLLIGAIAVRSLVGVSRHSFLSHGIQQPVTDEDAVHMPTLPEPTPPQGGPSWELIESRTRTS